MEKVLIRLPNDSYFEEMPIFLSRFKVEKEFEDEIFGWYDNTYISIKKTNEISYMSNLMGLKI